MNESVVFVFFFAIFWNIDCDYLNRRRHASFGAWLYSMCIEHLTFLNHSSFLFFFVFWPIVS